MKVKKAKGTDEEIGELLSRVVSGKMKQADVAKKLGISQAAVSKRIKKMQRRTTYTAIATNKIDKIVDGNVNIIDQLKNINTHANNLLKDLIPTIDNIIDHKKTGEEYEDIDPDLIAKKKRGDAQLAVKLMAEIRSQLGLMMDIYEMLYSLEGAAQFQQTVLDALEKVDPEIRKEVIAELNKKHSLRAALRF